METILETKKDDLPISIYRTNEEMGLAAADAAARMIQEATQNQGQANMIIATGNSQLTFLTALRKKEGIPWDRVNVFHMDEYVGIDANHPASFPRFLRQHIIEFVRPKNFYPISGQSRDPQETCLQYERLLKENPADLCALGIGENGHLAFNDPPFARFDDPQWVRVVQLAESCKRQQVGEGHFKSIDEVPDEAISLTIPALLAAKKVLAIVPEARKAEIVYQVLTGPVSPLCPASILRRAAHAHLYLDADSGAKFLTNRQPGG
jgi:glucosamine-6-phosphate deaminase